MMTNEKLDAKENLDFILSGLVQISSKGRKYLKNMAQTLVSLQNPPKYPIPDKNDEQNASETGIV
jgi:hypothetical protein